MITNPSALVSPRVLVGVNKSPHLPAVTIRFGATYPTVLPVKEVGSRERARRDNRDHSDHHLPHLSSCAHWNERKVSRIGFLPKVYQVENQIIYDTLS